MTPLARAVLGVALGLSALVAGVAIVAGLGVALIVAGVLATAASMFLVEVDRTGRKSP